VRGQRAGRSAKRPLRSVSNNDDDVHVPDKGKGEASKASAQCGEAGTLGERARRDEEKANLGAESMEWEMMILSNGLNIAPRRRTFGLFASENRKFSWSLDSLSLDREKIFLKLR
jgi:hypothetical protein